MAKHLQRWSLTAGTLTVLGLFVSMTGAGPVTAQNPKPVEVVNSPMVQAQQSGSWNVGINGSVNLGNTAANPVPVRDVDSSARAVAYFHRFNCSLQNGQQSCSSSDALPPGMRLVIETVSLQARAAAMNQKPVVGLNFQTNGQSEAMGLPLVAEGAVTNPIGERYAAVHSVRIYTDPDSQISIVFNRTATQDFVSTRADVSGYLVPCGPARVGQFGCPAP
ncbi:MAG: hypothetical protein ACRD5G_10405 [Candidatus Acidiferrales bacterium]